MRGLEDFVGAYDVRREIEDARDGAQSAFVGAAVIARSDAGATYTETGTLIMNGQHFEAERSYLWRDAGRRIDVLFADGRAFHDFDPTSGGHSKEHLCGQDMYRGGYDFSRWPRWAVTWDVAGPRKDYRSVTWYVRR